MIGSALSSSSMSGSFKQLDLLGSTITGSTIDGTIDAVDLRGVALTGGVQWKAPIGKMQAAGLVLEKVDFHAEPPFTKDDAAMITNLGASFHACSKKLTAILRLMGNAVGSTRPGSVRGVCAVEFVVG
jgi:hypothetical protein